MNRFIGGFLLLLGIWGGMAVAQPYQPHVIWDRSGQTDSSAYGYKILPLGDQNNDGFADWAVQGAGNGRQHGCLEFFHGAASLPLIPYHTYYSDTNVYYTGFGADVMGDVNGDDFADWVLTLTRRPAGATHDICLFLGGPAQADTPEWVVTTSFRITAIPIGDFNGDGFADIGLYDDGNTVFSILYGGNPMDTIPDWVIYHPPQGINQTIPYAVGDFNGDGASDFLCHNPNNGFNAIFLGGVSPDTVPAYTWTDETARPIGSVRSINGDPYDEFLFEGEDRVDVYFGRPFLYIVPDAFLHFSCTFVQQAISAGDVNRDGFNDVIMLNQTCDNNMFGSLTLHLGHPWLYSEPAIIIDGWSEPLNLIGIYTAAGLGDVNDDGVDDIAIGAYDDFAYLGWRGRCVILSGDTSLQAPISEYFTLCPSSFSLSCYPNPFNTSTTISFTLTQTSEVKIAVYDVLGRNVKSALPGDATGFLSAGEHHISFDGSDLSSGIYFIRVEAGEISQTQKLMLLK